MIQLIVTMIFAISFDQLTKLLAVNYLKDKTAIVIIENLLELQYVENYGAAFGIMKNKRIFFIIITISVILGIFFFMYKNYRYLSKSMKISLVLLFSGAVGNLLDRLRFGYVIDFISVKFGPNYNFPVFNIADMFIVISTVLIMLLVFLGKDDL